MDGRNDNSIKQHKRPKSDRAKAKASHDGASDKGSNNKGANRGLPRGRSTGCHTTFQQLPRAIHP